MANGMDSYALASASGLTFAFWFFLALSGAIAGMIYALMTSPSQRRREIGLGTVRKILAAPIALLIWAVIFAGVYLSSLAGFHTVRVDSAALRLAYAVPSWEITVPYSDIGDVFRHPAFKTRWRLEIYTRTGNRFASAPGSYAAVKQAAEAIEARRRRLIAGS